MLIKSNRKGVVKSDMEYELVLVDVSESPCERPKKEDLATRSVITAKSCFIDGRKNGIL